MTNPTEKQIQLNVGLAAVATDGNGISIDDNGNVGLIFFQIIDQNETTINANAVSNVRLNLPQLKQLEETIKKTIDQHEQKKARAAKEQIS